MIVHNPTDTPVRDYPIQDPKTGEVYLWSILPGETLDFPDYAGSYLVEIYAFLQRVVTKEQLEAERRAEEAKAKGKQFSPIKVVDNPQGGLTNSMAQEPAPTPEEKLPQNNPAAVPPTPPTPPVNNQMTGAIEGDEADKVPTAPSSKIPAPAGDQTKAAKASSGGKVICPECKAEFPNKGAAKTHYAHKHLDVPGL